MRAAGLLLLTAAIAAEDLVELHPVPLRVRTSVEDVELSSREEMGLMGLHLDALDPTFIPGLYGGLGGYGAAWGDRGGLFVLGATIGWRTPAWQGLRIDANGFAGGGGGADAGQGDGLMLRGQVMATLALGRWEVGGGITRTEFPQGEIADTGWTVGLNHLVDATLAQPWSGPEAQPATLAWQRWSIAPTYLAYLPQDDDRGRSSGKPLAERIDLVGIAGDLHFPLSSWRLVAQAAGACGGGAAGYMEVMGGIARRIDIIGGLYLDSRLLVGLGGGGDIDTGGGFMARSELGLGFQLAESWSIAARGGWVTAFNGDLDCPAVAGELRWSTDHLVLADGHARATMPAIASELERWDVVVGDAWYDVRSADIDDIHLVSVSLERPLSSWFALVGRGRSAWRGDVGGYSEGLFGARLGLSWWRLSVAAQGQAGAGGGGGLATGDGLIGEVQLTGRIRITDNIFLHGGAGRTEAIDGDFSADVVEAGLGWSFAVAQ